jgi:hypothetical protein
MTDSLHSGNDAGWLIHDIVVGALGGGAAGIVIGLFALARVDRPWLAVIAIGAAISAVFGVLRWERNRRRGAGPITVFAWLVMVLSIAFIALVISAVRNFT